MTEQQFPEPTVGALIFNKDKKVILMKSHKWSNKWVIPGGYIELGEKMEDALKREIKEETNLYIYNIKFILFQEFIYDEEFWKKKHFIFFNFICETNSSEVKLSSEGQEYIWATLKEAKKLDLENYTLKLIQEK